jgi:hypothetical protein
MLWSFGTQEKFTLRAYIYHRQLTDSIVYLFS